MCPSRLQRKFSTRPSRDTCIAGKLRTSCRKKCATVSGCVRGQPRKHALQVGDIANRYVVQYELVHVYTLDLGLTSVACTPRPADKSLSSFALRQELARAKKRRQRTVSQDADPIARPQARSAQATAVINRQACSFKVCQLECHRLHLPG